MKVMGERCGDGNLEICGFMVSNVNLVSDVSNRWDGEIFDVWVQTVKTIIVF